MAHWPTPSPLPATPFLAIGEEFLGTEARPRKRHLPEEAPLHPVIHNVNMKHAIVDGTILMWEMDPLGS